jgi:hypothetical protein
MSFEAYSVAVKLKLIDDVTGGLLGIAGHFKVLQGTIGKTQAQILALEASWKKIKTTALIGGAALAGGAGALDLLVAPVKAAREYELAFTKFKTLNLGEAINTQANQFARGTKLMGVSATDLMGVLSESVGLFGTYAEAQKHAGQLAQLNVANSAIFGGKIERLDEGSIRSLLKFMDRRGALGGDEAKYQAGLNLAEKMVTGSGGFIKFSDLGAFSQNAGTAFRGLSDKGVMDMALLMQEQGGAAAGASWMSLYQNLVAGRTPVKTMLALQDMGIGTVGQVTHGTVGGKTSTSLVMTGIKDAALLQSDPPEWFRTVLLPALASHNINDEASILKMTNDLLSNRRASNSGSIMSTQQLQIMRDAALTKNALGADKVIKQYSDDPNAKWTDMTSKWKNMLVEIGEAALPLVTKAMSYLIPVLKGITSFAHSFPTTTKLLVGSFAALAGLAVAGGTLTLITAGFRGLALIPGLTKVGGGLGSIASGLVNLAGGLPGVLGLLGRAGLVGAAGAAGYVAGSWLNSHFHLAEKIGGFLSGQNDYDPNKGRGPYVASGKIGRAIAVHTAVNLDGHKIADVVSHHQANGMDGGAGGQMFDPTLTLPDVGLNFAR